MEIADRPVEIRLTTKSAGALCTLLNHEVARVERWIIVHEGSATLTVVQDARDYLAQIRVLQNQVAAGWDAFICPDADQAPRMNGKRGGRLSKHQTAALRTISG